MDAHDMLEEYKVVRPNLNNPDLYRVRLPAGPAMTLGVYDETADDPNFWDEVMHGQELMDFVDRTKDTAAEILASALKYIEWENDGKSYRDVDLILTGRALRKSKDEPYQASEDLVFTFQMLYELWDFIDQATYLLQYKDQQVR